MGLGVIGKVTYDVHDGYFYLLPDFILRRTNFEDAIRKAKEMVSLKYTEAIFGLLYVGVSVGFLLFIYKKPVKQLSTWLYNKFSALFGRGIVGRPA